MYPEEKFVMICQHATGDKKYDELVARAGQVKNLEFLERVGFNEVEDYFKRANVFVCTSKGEGFPNTYVQASKCATPIYSLCVNPDDFLTNYKCGICANDNWDEFVQELAAVLKSGKLREYGENARKYAEQKHDIKSITEKYKKLFRELG
jgi:glycosyltransferase involved in cell wall biosynthesis